MRYKASNTIRNYSPREEFGVTGMSMKYKGASLQLDTKKTFLSDTLFLCVFMRRNDKLNIRARLTLNSL